MSDSYHHGNLRQALIDAGIKIINENGEAGLSLRKVAALCDVSHAAPYAHFKDKDELIKAIKEKVTSDFMAELQKAVDSGSDAKESLVNLGQSYVSFFLRKPDYFKFLFSNLNIVAHLRTDKEFKEDYPPFVLLKRTYFNYLNENKIKQSREEQEIDLLMLWAHVHGLASIACMSGVEVSFDWDKMLSEGILVN